MLKFLWLTLLLLGGVAQAGDYAGTAGWNNEHDGKTGMVDFRYQEISEARDRRGLWIEFSFSLKFKGDHGLRLPKEMSISAQMNGHTATDTLSEGGGIIQWDRETWYNSRPIGWFHCTRELEGTTRKECILNFRGVQAEYDWSPEPYSWVRLIKIYEHGKLCYLTGTWWEYHGSEEDSLVWHSKRLCDRDE